MPISDPAKRREAQRRADAKRAGKRTRAWTAVVYPESAPENWKDILADELVQSIVSPLHDKDVEPTGETKKPHYHVVISFSNPTTYELAKEVFEKIGAVVPPEKECRVKDFRQMARYLCHLDQPNKYQYDPAEVLTFGAIDYADLIMSAADQDEVVDAMMDFIDEHKVYSFSRFSRYVRKSKPEWKSILYHKSAYIIREYIRALEWEKQTYGVIGGGTEDDLDMRIDEETGEIVGDAEC